MKPLTSTLIAIMLLISCRSYAGHGNIPVVKTHSNTVTLRLDDQTFEEEIPFGRLAETDTIRLSAYKADFVFGLYTDIDSLEHTVPLNSTFQLHVIKEGHPPLTIVLKNGLELETLQFDLLGSDADIQFKYEENLNSPYLQQLRSEYPIDSLAALGSSELAKARIIASWVHGLWEHDGWNEPEKKDALYILNEVKKGQRFRCVEYGIVTATCLNSIGLKSRTLSLRTKDVETRPSGAGHVVMEVFINELGKWVMIDSQYDMITLSDGVPLNAVELQDALTKNKKIEMWTTEEEAKVTYIPWIYPYLYYFSVPFDSRENITSTDRLRKNGKSELMLVPIGVKEPTVFQQKYPINYCIYTHSLQDFYRKP